MFQSRFLLLIILIPLAGISGLLGGTSVVHGIVMTPYETSLVSASTALRGQAAQFANQTVDAVARAASDKDVHAALASKKMSPAAEGALLAPAGGYGAPSFALLVTPDGAVVASAGAESKLPTALAGFPVVAEALTGVARDGLWIQDGKPVHIVAAAIWDGNSPTGGVVLGWPWAPTIVESFARSTGNPVFVVDAAGTSAIGNGEANAAAMAKREAFGDPTTSIGPFPVLLPETARYLVSAAPLYPNESSFFLTTLIDRDSAFGGLASLQLGIIGLSLLLSVLVVVILWLTMSGVNRPMNIILDHLAQVQQGNNVGILPEAGLNGPFLRLGKQINMILQAMPSSRPGGAVAPMGFSSPGFDPPAPSSALSGLGDISDFKPPTSSPSLPSTSSAPPSFSMPPTSSPSSGPSPAAPGPAPQPSAPLAASPPTGGLAGLFDEPDPLAAFRVPPKSATPPPQPAPQPPPQPQFDPDPPPQHEMQPEATVMFQVPQSLLAASAVEQPKKAPPPAAHVDDNRTVVAQVPQELLAQVAPKNDVDASDEAHYKEVYEKFVQTRIECGEDTSDLSYERFVAKLLKNRQQIVDKHKAKSVRFQVYVKDGKAALRALPVRD